MGMRYYPKEDYEKEELVEMNADSWQIELLKKNPDYNAWGNYEDYMSDGSGWNAPSECETVDEGLWGLDDLNELVNFYFELYRENKACEHCEQSGQNPETRKIEEDWYDFKRTGRRWCDKITDIEFQALKKEGRTRGYNSAEEMNEAERSSRGIGPHDAINRWICVEARAKHLGVYGKCEHCEGKGYIFTEPKAKVGLQLWMLHPRKGCSRGVYIKEIKEDEVPKVIEYLKKARERNYNRFSKL